MNAVLNYLRRIKEGATLNLLVQIFSTFSAGFASYYFKTKGVPVYQLVMIWAISPLASLPVVLLSNAWNVRRYLRLGLLSYTGMALSLLFFNPYSFLMFAIFNGLTLGFFWVSLSYIFFRNSTSKQNAKDSSIFFLLGPLVSIVLPPLGAVMIGNLGFRAFFFLAALLSLVPLLYVRRDGFDHIVKQRFRDADRAFSGLRLLPFFNGALHFFQGNFLPIYALLFLNTEYQVGGLLSYLALISLLVSLLVSYASDKYKRRVEILYPLLIVMGFLIMLMPTIKTLPVLVVVVGVYAVLDNLSMPIRFAVPMDLVKTDIGFWRVNEFYGNIGRTIVFAAAALLLYFGNYWLPFLIFALMTVAFPFIISRKVNSFQKSAQ